MCTRRLSVPDRRVVGGHDQPRICHIGRADKSHAAHTTETLILAQPQPKLTDRMTSTGQSFRRSEYNASFRPRRTTERSVHLSGLPMRTERNESLDSLDRRGPCQLNRSRILLRGQSTDHASDQCSIALGIDASCREALNRYSENPERDLTGPLAGFNFRDRPLEHQVCRAGRARGAIDEGSGNIGNALDEIISWSELIGDTRWVPVLARKGPSPVA